MEKFTVSSSSSPKYITDLDAISEKIEKAVKDKDIIKYKDAYNEQYNTMKQHLIEDQPDFPPKTFTDVSEHIDYLLGMILMMKAKHEVEQCEDAEIIAKLMHRIDALEAKEKGENKCSIRFSL